MECNLKQKVIQNDSLSRSVTLDIVKGIITVLVVYGHCLQYCCPSNIDFFENVAFKIIYSFHMPCFALISGFLFSKSIKNRVLNGYISKRVLRLSQSIIFGGFFILMISSLLQGVTSLSLFESIKFFILGLSSYANNLWFLWSILASVISVGIACSITNKFIPRIAVLFMASAFIYNLPHGILSAYVYPYFVIGFMFSEYGKNAFIKLLYRIRFISVPIFAVMMFFFEKKHYIYATGLYSGEYSIFENISIDIFRYAIGLFGSISLIVTIDFIAKTFASKCNISNKFVNLLSSIGSKSMHIYIVQSAFIGAVFGKLSEVIYSAFPSLSELVSKYEVFYDLVFIPCVTAFLMVFIMLLIKLMEKNKVTKLVFGK